MISPDETCDDNKTITDGCNSTCDGELDGWSCTGGSPTTSTVCTPICGDNLKVGIETCEDGTPLDGAGCASNCIGPELGYNCDPLIGNTSVLNTC